MTKKMIINIIEKAMIYFLIIVLIIPISLSFSDAADSSGNEKNSDEPEITSAAAIIIEYDLGLVIYEYNADEMRVPASMVKMVAVFVVLDALKAGHITYDSIIEISRRVERFSNSRAYSNIPLSREETYTVRDLLDMVMVRSASAATIALGEGIFGSEAALIEKMNEKAIELGIPATFRDSWGGSPANMISARGMAEMARALIMNHPEILEITSKNEIVFDEITYGNTNRLIYEYPGADGMKTGFTNPAGWCLTGTALRENRRIITVTMGSESGHRLPDSVLLLDYGFANINSVTAARIRNSLLSSEQIHTESLMLIPISAINIYEAQYFTLLELAMILNGH